MRWTWTISFADHPELSPKDRADKLLLEAMERGLGEVSSVEGEFHCPSRSQLQRLMEEGQVRREAAPIRPKDRLKAGERITVDFPPPKPLELVPENLPLDVLFQDDHILVLNKPPGLTVHPSATQMEGTLVHALLHHIKDLSGIGGKLRPGIVHRLDKNTSGALVITKTDLAHRALVETFSRHAIERAYWALVYGAPKSCAGTIDTLIGRNTTDRKKMTVHVRSGRRAVSQYKVLKTFSAARGAPPFASWLEVRLETGRTHQVRVHLNHLGHSVLGDPVYGTPTERNAKWMALPEGIQEAVRKLPGQALHARILGFDHPVGRESLRFEAVPPPAFQQLLDALLKYSSPA